MQRLSAVFENCRERAHENPARSFRAKSDEKCNDYVYAEFTRRPLEFH